VTVDPSDSPVQHVRASLDQRLRALLAHEPGTRTGEDIERSNIRTLGLDRKHFED